MRTTLALSLSDVRRIRVQGLLETYEAQVKKFSTYQHVSFYNNPSLKNSSPVVQKLYAVMDWCDENSVDADDFIRAQFLEWEKTNKHAPPYPTVQYLGASTANQERYFIWKSKVGHPGVVVESEEALYRRKVKSLLSRRTNLTEDLIFDDPLLILWLPVSVVKKHKSFIERRDRGYFDGWAGIVLKDLL